MRAAFAGLCALAAAGCATATATAPVPVLTIPVAAVLREPCPRPDFLAVETVGELAAFSVRQEGALAVCEARRSAAVAVIDVYNALGAELTEKLKPHPWWRVWAK